MADNYLSKGNYLLRYFFNAGYDQTNGLCDAEGTDIYDDELHFLGSIYWKSPEEIIGLTDEEFDELRLEYGIID